jgi:membrane protease YdiL (CAAX protease family)
MDTASDPLPDPAPGDPGATPPVAAPPPPNFCNRCGAPWDPAWTECPHCVGEVSSIIAQSPPRMFSPAVGAPLFSALVLYFMLLACSGIAIVAIRWSSAPPASTLLVIDVVAAVIVLAWVLKDYRRVRDGLAGRGSPVHYLLAVVLGTGTFLLAVFNIKLLGGLVSADDVRYSDVFLKEGYGWSVVILSLCVQPPIIEELAFRGVVLGGLRGVLGPTTAVVVSALLFMTLHLTPLGFPFLFVMGVLAGWLRGRSGSLYPCMLMHFTHNFLVVLVEMGGG